MGSVVLNIFFKKERMDIYEPPVWAKTAFISLISLALVIFELVAIIALIFVMATLGVITGVEVTVKVLFLLLVAKLESPANWTVIG